MIESIVKVSVDSGSYDVIIGSSILSQAGKLSEKVISPCRCIIVTDDTVASLYADLLTSSLEKSGFKPFRFVIPHGEDSKNTENYISLLNFCAENEISRSDCLFALGGGVVGDLTGFAAATYLRGLKFIQIPTTLLAAVDSSVGGKTAVNLPSGKNLVGAFWQPSLVICDYTLLYTLTDEIFADGCAEVIKYGIINDPSLFESLKTPIRSQLGFIIKRCVENKRDIVAVDERDHGCRQLLNLGHTFGHAIEACSEFTISHGSAVAIGTVIVAKAAVNSGMTDESTLFEIEQMFKKYKLPIKCPFSAEQLTDVALSDKKRKSDNLTLVIPYAVGNTRLFDINISQLCDFVKRGL